jgi:DNA-binding beta-propeller fold protein YncE
MPTAEDHAPPDGVAGAGGAPPAGEAGAPPAGEAGAPPAGEAGAALPMGAEALPITTPVRVAVAPDGTVYLSDSGSHAVLGYQGDQRVFELPGVPRPLGLAVADERLLVGSAGTHSVEAYSRVTGAFLFAFGQGDGEVTMPNAIAVAPDGARTYVVDSPADRVAFYDAAGLPLGGFGQRGGGPGELRFPVAVAVDATRVAVADQGNHRVQVFDRDGAWLMTVGEAAPGQGLVRPQGVALVGAEVAVLDAATGAVVLYGPTGARTGAAGTRGSCPACVDLALDLAFDAADATFVLTDPNRRRWVRLPLAGLEAP